MIAMMSGYGCIKMEDEYIRRHHRHEIRDNQCSSSLVKHIKAPVHLVWSLVRSFDQPQKYKPFVSRCIVQGDLEIGSVREVNVKSGLPATTSTERLELLDDEEHIFGMRIVGGDHRLKLNKANYTSLATTSCNELSMELVGFGLIVGVMDYSNLAHNSYINLVHCSFSNMQNYSSIVTVHPEIIDGRPGTLVIESFVVDVPDGNTKDETCYFVEALIKCNLKSLSDVSERLAIQDRTEPIDRM
ncbi:Abscisic acid receptor PYL8 [Vitis vinifera]|uniref:Abscisic acid receptor PYL8 n=1 Tax=Vitis vinifera TaxID=29760 RepID=A0A438J596_VITVI|nr:Abscisic acid receptor PYL8 [Vitis vinifera]